MSNDDSHQESNADALPKLPKTQRRVLGTLMEKGFTTPESYPLTLKSLTSGCNQKSNRDPVVNYSEDAVQESIEGLAEHGLVKVIFTESGRTERYRHFARHCIKLTEPQWAIVTELLLRGRQSLGDLRARASRMVPIESLDELRTELTSLQEKGLVRFGGRLEQRGVEVDHDLYAEGPPSILTAADDSPPEPHARPVAANHPTPSAPSRSAAPPVDDSRWDRTAAEVAELRAENRALTETVNELRDRIADLESSVDLLRSELGG